MNRRIGVLTTVANPKRATESDEEASSSQAIRSYLRWTGNAHAGAARKCPAAGGMDWRMARVDNSAPREAFTFDDVLLRPGRSEILPSQADIRTRITREISLNIPIVASAMDTVTEAKMAIAMAQAKGLDLVEVAPTARPPVCKIMDYGKFKYEAAQKAREARKNQVQTIIKEMKLRPKIDQHDYDTKKNHIERFLQGGDKVKVTIMFRGREQSRPELGYRLLQKLAEDIGELGFVESAPLQDGRNMVMVLAPNRKKGSESKRRPTDEATE